MTSFKSQSWNEALKRNPKGGKIKGCPCWFTRNPFHHALMMFAGCVMFRSTTVQMIDRIAYLSAPPLQAPTTRLTFLSPSSPFLFKLRPTSLFTSSSSSFFSLTSPPRSTMLHHDPLVSDLYATAISAAVAFSLLRLWQETAKRGIFDQVGRKIGFFSSG